MDRLTAALLVGTTGAALLVVLSAVVAGCGFFVAGTAGLLRFPDLLRRLHALTKADNLGLGLVVAGVAVHLASPAVAVRLAAVRRPPPLRPEGGVRTRIAPVVVGAALAASLAVLLATVRTGRGVARHARAEHQVRVGVGGEGARGGNGDDEEAGDEQDRRQPRAAGEDPRGGA